MSTYSIIHFPADALPITYHNMILSKWMRSLRYGNEYFKLIDSDAFFKNYNRYLDVILSRPNTSISLAVLSDDHDVVLGFSVYEGKTLHYVHVHKDYRKMGIGKDLVPKEMLLNKGEGFYISHLTNVGTSIWSSMLSNAKFNPF